MLNLISLKHCKYWPYNFFIHNDENTTVKFCGLSIVSDILEHCGPDSVPFKEMFVKVISESVTSANASIRQICTNAIGMAAQYGGDGYAEFCFHC